MSDNEIKVIVCDRGNRKFHRLRYTDPFSGKNVWRSAKTADLKEATREAGKWQAELNEGRYLPPSKATWEAFRERYETEIVSGKAKNTMDRVACVLDSFERLAPVDRMSRLTSGRITTYQKELRKQGNAESTIASNLAHLRAALRWAVEWGMIHKLPTIERPTRAKSNKMMKGRPVALEEFERMIDSIPKALQVKNSRSKKMVDAKPEAIDAWKRYLWGLWRSGLRLAESLELYWDRQDKLRVDLDGKRPMLHIPAELEKGNQDRLLPMAPEFAEFLLAVPEEQRTGPVFTLPARGGRRPSAWWVSRVVTKIGKAAGVKVQSKIKTDKQTGKPKELVKYASAHDLRRSFGARWATRVMPQVLMQLMRHESIDTTLKFYVGRNAETTADVLWAAHESAKSPLLSPVTKTEECPSS